MPRKRVGVKRMKNRKRYKKYVALMLAVVLGICMLSACGGKDEDVSFTWESPEVKDGMYHIAFVGDDIFYGTAVADNRQEESITAYFQEQTQDYQVLNYGVPGTTLQEDGANPYVKTEAYQESLDADADIYVIMLGTNDAKEESWDAKRYKTELTELVKTYQDVTETEFVYLIQPPKCFPENWFGKVKGGISDDIVGDEMYDVIKEVAEETGAKYMDLYGFTQEQKKWFANGVHPNAEGNEEIAKFLYEDIKNWMAYYNVQHPLPPQLDPERRHIVCIGDSVTFGSGVRESRETESYPALLQTMVEEEYQVINCGLSGKCVQDESDSPYRKTKYYRFSKEVAADIYIIMLGTNDSKPQNWDAERYERELTEFVNEYKALSESGQVYLMRPPVAYPQKETGVVVYDIDKDVIQDEVIDIVTRVAEQTGAYLIDLNTYTMGHEEWFEDGVHMNGIGNEKAAEYIYQELDKNGAITKKPKMTEVVEVNGGKVQGYLSADGQVEIFKGIPYAAAPIGDLRWKAPQDVKRWEGVRNCTRWSTSAMQNDQSTFMCYTDEFIVSSKRYSEDCLYLNVWTNGRNEERDKPVIVFVHGGSFTSGGSSCEVYNGEEIARKGAVFVSINYRVGVFGYLSTSEMLAEDPSAGNFGMMDQLKALQWVKENIAAFGGNPNNVTLMGQSAGAGSVQALIASPASEGLFAHAVTESYDSISANPYATAQEKAKLGDGATEGKSLEELREMSARDLLQISWNMLVKGQAGPCIDGVLLTKSYEEALADGSAVDVDIMTGMTSNDETPESMIQCDSFMFPTQFSEEVSKTDGLMAVQNFVSLAKAHSGTCAGKVYLYNFSHSMPMNAEENGAFHSSEIPYFLNYFTPVRKEAGQQEDFDLGDVMSDYLVNFARTGNPNGEGLAEWPANEGDFTYMNLDTTCEMKTVSDKVKEEAKEKYEELRYLFK